MITILIIIATIFTYIKIQAFLYQPVYSVVFDVGKGGKAYVPVEDDSISHCQVSEVLIH